MKDAYTTKQIAIALDVPVRTANRRAKRGGWPSRSRSGRGGGYEWLASGLPGDVKTALAVREAKQESKSVPPALPGVVIPDWAHRIGMARYRLVLEWRAFTAKGAAQGKGAATKAFLAAYHSGQLLPAPFEVLGAISDKTLYRWDKKLRDHADDYTVLCDGRGKWKRGGKKGCGQIGREAEQIFLTTWLTPNKPSIQLAYKATEAVLLKRGLPVPSYASFRRFAQRFDTTHHDLVVLKREGEKALKDSVGPYIARNTDLLSVGDVLFCDGHVLNFNCLHPTTGKPVRMTLICWFDWRSHMPVGWEIMPSENTQAISAALKMAIQNLGQYPRCVYIDNGKAFRSKYFTKTDADFGEFNGLYARLGIAVQFSRPYEARTKIVERFFRTFNEQCARLINSYSGASIADKPAWTKRNEKWHQARHSDWTPRIEDAAAIFRAFVGWYGQQRHRGMGGQRPLEVLSAGRGEGVPLEDLNRHFLMSKLVKRPDRCGFTIAGIRYESDALYGLNKPFQAKYSWADLSEVHLYDEEGRKIGTARPTEAIHPLARQFGNELDLLKVQEENKRQKSLKQSTLRLADALDGAPCNALEQLPWMQREKAPIKAVPKPKQAPRSELTTADRQRLENVRQKALESVGNQVRRPAFFSSPYDRYEWCFFTSVRDGQPISEKDRIFMREYETSDEYREHTGERFRQLRVLYGVNACAN